MQRSELGIGVFDSGMGGLTVLRALREFLPNENFIYLGDTARLPYGTKSAETVQQYATQMTRILVEKEIKSLVIACNTATTAALDHLQALYPDLLIIGVVLPGAIEAVSASKGNILVMATETTIASQAYHRAIQQYMPNAEIKGRACSLLVALAEEGIVDHKITRLTLEHYLQDIYGVDTVLLGCTHFPVFKNLISSVMPSVNVVDSATATAKMLKNLLLEKGLANMQKQGNTTYYVTDAVNRFCRIGKIFLGESIDSERVSLIDA